MNYIPYPRIDLDNHRNLVSWRAKEDKIEGDWTHLKEYLADSARIIDNKHAISKCWYSELPQGDDYARDVEHYRPKNQASPLTTKQIKEIEILGEINYEQDDSVGNYNWLEFDYRNYRLVTAKPNRGGAKHIFFPIAKNTSRLTAGQLPWEKLEYPYFLDPTSKHDASLLMVKPNGDIAPITPKTQLTQTHFDNIAETWHQDGFNYLRATVTIKLYRLNDAVFVKGRKEVYDSVIKNINILNLCMHTNAAKEILENTIENIVGALIPSAPFSLAAKCALIAYQAPDKSTSDSIQSILTTIEKQVNNLKIDWNKP